MEIIFKSLAENSPQIVGMTIVVCVFLWYINKTNQRVNEAIDKNNEMLGRVYTYLDFLVKKRNKNSEK